MLIMLKSRKMSRFFSTPIALLLSVVALTGASPASAKTYTATLIDGGGIDNISLTLKTANAKEIEVYCMHACNSQWFDYDKENELSSLKGKYKNKKVTVTVIKRINKGDVAGPGDDEVLDFVTQIKFLN